MITTTKELQDFIEANHKAQIETTSRAAALRFVAAQKSAELEDLSRDDLINLVIFGLPAMNADPAASIQEWLNEYNKNDAEMAAGGFGSVSVESLLNSFFNDVECDDESDE